MGGRRVETVRFIRATGRMVRAAGRRVAGEDEEELRELIGLHVVVAESVQFAVDGMRARGCSWAYVASATGVTRQSAQERWGKRERRTA
jgi:hypothetical protein